MGFRNPPTSASAVDTGDTAGVKLFGNATNPGAGVVQWYVGGSTAKAEFDSSQTGSGGSSLALTNAQSNAALTLKESGLPAGGYQGIAALTGPEQVALQADAVLVADRNGARPVDLRRRLAADASNGFAAQQTGLQVGSTTANQVFVVPTSYTTPIPSALLSVSGATFTTKVAGTWALRAQANSDATVAGYAAVGLNMTGGTNGLLVDRRQRATGYGAAGTLAQTLTWVDYFPAGSTFAWWVQQITSTGIPVNFDVYVYATLIA